MEHVLLPQHESAEARLARFESKLDGLSALTEQRFDALEQRLSDRYDSYQSRLEYLEASARRQGERLGALEAAGHRYEGGFFALSKTLALGAAAGGLFVKLWEWGSKLP